MDGKKVGMKNTDIKVIAKTNKKEKNGYEAARIAGGHNHYLSLITDNHLDNCRS